MKIGIFEIVNIKEEDFEVRLYFNNGDYLPVKICGRDLEMALQTIFLKEIGYEAENDK